MMTTSEQQAVIDYLQSAQSIRDRTQQLFDLCQANQLDHFSCDLSQLDRVADYVIDTTQQLYPDFDVPFHSRWRHFGQQRLSPGLSPEASRQSQTRSSVMQGETREGSRDAVRSQLDLVIVSVLLDAGAGRQWRYHDISHNQVLGRSEGLAVASLRAFEQGLFSSHPDFPHQVDAVGLQRLTEADLAEAFQVSETNPLVGLTGRLSLLNQLGAVLASQPERFGPGRPGYLFDYWLERYGLTLDAGTLLTEVLKSFGTIWPGRVTLANTNLGDVWSHPALSQQALGENLVPFHKLSQWLTYSLVEPLTAAGMTVPNLNALTGLAEYRNGGLCVDLGLLVPKHPDVTQQPHPPDSSVVVEWRALTVILLDLIGDGVRHRLQKSPQDLPLIKILEGGTWAAGRRIAKQVRPNGTPPITIQSDGTVF